LRWNLRSQNVRRGTEMEQDLIMQLLEHGVLVTVLFFLLQRVMTRLDAVTDKLITILERQEQIQTHLAGVEQRRHEDTHN